MLSKSTGSNASHNVGKSALVLSVIRVRRELLSGRATNSVYGVLLPNLPSPPLLL